MALQLNQHVHHEKEQMNRTLTERVHQNVVLHLDWHTRDWAYKWDKELYIDKEQGEEKDLEKLIFIKNKTFILDFILPWENAIKKIMSIKIIMDSLNFMISWMLWTKIVTSRKPLFNIKWLFFSLKPIQ